MMIALSGSSPVASEAASQPVAKAAAPAASSATLAPDTVSISTAGRQASQASGDVDSDGDSH